MSSAMFPTPLVGGPHAPRFGHLRGQLRSQAREAAERCFRESGVSFAGVGVWPVPETGEMHPTAWPFPSREGAIEWYERARHEPGFAYLAVFDSDEEGSAADARIREVIGADASAPHTRLSLKQQINHAADDLFWARYPSMRDHHLNPHDPADLAMIPKWIQAHDDVTLAWNAPQQPPGSTASFPAGTTVSGHTMGPKQAAIYGQTNGRFWNETHYKPGLNLDPNDPADRPYIETWKRIYHEVLAEVYAGLRTHTDPPWMDYSASRQAVLEHPVSGIVGARPRGHGARSSYVPPASPTTVQAHPTTALSADDINHATDALFWAETKYKPGLRLDPNDPFDRAMMPAWRKAHARVLRGDTEVHVDQGAQTRKAIAAVFDRHAREPAAYYLYIEDVDGPFVSAFQDFDTAGAEYYQLCSANPAYVALFGADDSRWPNPASEFRGTAEPPHVSGDPTTMNSLNPWLPILRNAPLSVGGSLVDLTTGGRHVTTLVGAIAPVLAPATGGITAQLRLDANRVLHATICVDGKCYRGQADVAGVMEAVLQKIAAYHQELHGAGGNESRPVIAGGGHGGGGHGGGGHYGAGRFRGGHRPRWGRGGNWGAGYSYYVPPVYEVVEEYDGQDDDDQDDGQQPGVEASAQASAVASGDIMMSEMDRAVRAAGEVLVAELVGHHVTVACAGWWDDLSGAVKKAAGGLEHAAMGTLKKLKGPIGKAANYAVANIPGIGPLVAPMASKLTDALVDAAAGDPKAQAQAKAMLNQAYQLAKSDPHVKQALDLAHKAVAKTTAAYHLAQTASNAAQGDPIARQQVQRTVQQAQQGDPAAQEAVQVMDQTIQQAVDPMPPEETAPLDDATAAAINGWMDFIPGVAAAESAYGHLAGHHRHHRHHHHHPHHVEQVGAHHPHHHQHGHPQAVRSGWWPVAAAAGLGLGLSIANTIDSFRLLKTVNAESDRTDNLEERARRLERFAVEDAGFPPVVGTGGPSFVQIVGAAVSSLRDEAKAFVQGAFQRDRKPALGYVRTSAGPSVIPFGSVDDADDWFGALDPKSFLYAAYFDTSDPTWPEPQNEATGTVVKATPAQPQVGHWALPLLLGAGAGAGGALAWDRRDQIKKWIVGV